MEKTKEEESLTDIEELMKALETGDIEIEEEEESDLEKSLRGLISEPKSTDINNWTPRTITSIMYQSMLTTLFTWDIGYESELFGYKLSKSEKRTGKIAFMQGVGLATTTLLYNLIAIEQFSSEEVNKALNELSEAITIVIKELIGQEGIPETSYIGRLMIKKAAKISKRSHIRYLKYKLDNK